MSNQVAMFLSLKPAGVDKAYRRAAQILRERGLSANLVYDPYTGAVDAYGAILLACGADTELLAQGDTEPTSCGAPEASLKRIALAIDYIEAMTDMDISDWSCQSTRIAVIDYLEALADRIEISVVSETRFRK